MQSLRLNPLYVFSGEVMATEQMQINLCIIVLYEAVRIVGRHCCINKVLLDDSL